jgi:hypothetical protein
MYSAPIRGSGEKGKGGREEGTRQGPGFAADWPALWTQGIWRSELSLMNRRWAACRFSLASSSACTPRSASATKTPLTVRWRSFAARRTSVASGGGMVTL